MLKEIATCSIEQVYIDPDLTLASAEASVAAYVDFNNKPFESPKNYEYVDRFTGCVNYSSPSEQEEQDGPEEKFGLIFRSTIEGGTYLIAFRGTASLRDAVRDIYIKTVPFHPYDAPSFPKDVMVATGFNGIYTSKSDSMIASMQEQLFNKLKDLDPAPTKVLVTGHSLGGALASLFTLDVAASRPDLTVSNSTLASPRVGTEKWQSTYNETYSLETVTFRIANFYDWVPSLPPEWLEPDRQEAIFGYKHVGQRFLMAFYVKYGIDPTPRHSMLNYQIVLNHAVWLPAPQVWEGEFKDAVKGDKALSVCPPSTVTPTWEEFVQEQEKQAATVAAQ